MRHLLTTLAVVFALSLSTQVNAQVDILAGLGFSYGTNAKTIGLQFRGDVDITDEWGGSLNIIPYFKSDLKYWEINFDGHYMFFDSDPWSAYALAGLNLTTVGIKGVTVPGFGSFGTSTTKVGLNLGGGARYALLDNVVLYGEIKYVIIGSELGQLVISLGGMYRF